MIALSNPFSSTIRLYLQDEINKKNKLQIATLTFDYLKTTAEKSNSNKEINNLGIQDSTENNEKNTTNLHSGKLSARMDILKEYSNSPKLLSKLFNHSMCRCTRDVMRKMNDFPNYPSAAENEDVQKLHNAWKVHIKEINTMILANSKKEKGIVVSKEKIYILVVMILVGFFIYMGNIPMAALIVAIGAFIIKK